MHTSSPSCLALSPPELSCREEAFEERGFWTEQYPPPVGSLARVSCFSGNGIVLPKSFITGSFSCNILIAYINTGFTLCSNSESLYLSLVSREKQGWWSLLWVVGPGRFGERECGMGYGSRRKGVLESWKEFRVSGVV